MDRVVGILGGMGPQATVDLMTKIIRATPARVEADHVRMLVDLNPHVPSRSDALLRDGESPGPTLAAMARKLVGAGAQVLAMPCNTAHAYAYAILEAVDVPLLDMLDLTTDEVLRRAPAGAPVGLCATRGTRRTRLYHDRFVARGARVLDVEEEDQVLLDDLIADVKTRPVDQPQRAAMGAILARLAERGAAVVVAGCTEIPLLLPEPPPLPVVDPTDVLARAVVAHCKEGVPDAD